MSLEILLTTLLYAVQFLDVFLIPSLVFVIPSPSNPNPIFPVQK